MTDWTTLLERIGIRWPRSAPLPQCSSGIVPADQSHAHVPGDEYQALYTYLERRYASVVVLTFEQIEALLGFSLPTPARTERGWWTDIEDPQPQCTAWIAAGRTAAPNLAAGIITFERLV